MTATSEPRERACEDRVLEDEARHEREGRQDRGPTEERAVEGRQRRWLCSGRRRVEEPADRVEPGEEQIEAGEEKPELVARRKSDEDAGEVAERGERCADGKHAKRAPPRG